MLENQLLWRCSKSVLSGLLLMLSLYSFSMEDNQGTKSPNDNRNGGGESNQNDISSKKDDDRLPEWVVEECLKNMSSFMKGIYNYWRLGVSDNPDRVQPSAHTFLLVGGHGTSKSTTIKSMFQELSSGSDNKESDNKKTVTALSLFSKNNNEAKKNQRDVFSFFDKKEKMNNKVIKLLIIKRLEKVVTCTSRFRVDKVRSFFKDLAKLGGFGHKVITAVTANSTEGIPVDFINVFGGRVIKMQPWNGKQLIDAFDYTIKQRQIHVNRDACKAVGAYLRKGGYSLGDVRQLIDMATVFAYTTEQLSKPVLTKYCFKQAFHQYSEFEKKLVTVQLKGQKKTSKKLKFFKLSKKKPQNGKGKSESYSFCNLQNSDGGNADNSSVYVQWSPNYLDFRK